MIEGIRAGAENLQQKNLWQTNRITFISIVNKAHTDSGRNVMGNDDFRNNLGCFTKGWI